ncbi:MAG: ABC transporter permease [Bryobacteraceae bacterium]
MRTFISRLKALFHQRVDEQELDEELRAHIALLTERYINQGMNANDAQAAARRQFGRDTQLKEHLREQRAVLVFESILQDLRYALRQLRKSPAFSLTATLTLALGIGANTAIFSIVQAVLLRPLPYKDTQKLVMVSEQNLHRGWLHNIVSAANFKDWRKRNHVFTDMALIDPFLTYNLTGNGEPVEVAAEQVTPNLFSLLGVQPLYGRAFLPEEGRPGSARVVVMGHALWQRRYGSDRSIVGKQIPLNGESFTVIGVMPANFSSAYFGEANAQIWVSALDLSNPERTSHGYISIARLGPGVTLRQAQAEMDVVAAGLEKQYADNRGWGVGLIGLHDEVVGNSRPALSILLAAVALILLIVCVNVANLLLARGAVRVRELAVRKALGANRGRIILQLLTESALLSTAGALAGLWIASFGAKGLLAIAPVDTPGIETAGLHPMVLCYTAGIAFLTAMLFGLLPALGISNRDLSGSLKESGRGSTDGANAGKIRGMLVSAEFALSLMLVVSAALMMKTLIFMHRINPGFRSDHVVSIRVPLNDVKYNEGQQAAFYHALLERLNAVPGIRYATVSRGVPFFGWAGQGFVTAENPNPSSVDMPDGNFLAVGPQYFNVLRIPLIKGRAFSEHDTDNVLHVAIVNEMLARQTWPGQNPIAKRIKVSWDKALWLTVVGVAANVRTMGLDQPFLPEIYAPYTQHPWLLTPRQLLIRTDAEPLSIVPSVRQIIRELNPDQPIADVKTLDAIASEPLALRRFLTCLLGGFAFLALLLAAIGVYGVMGYSVAQRLREIGIRMALGAGRHQVLHAVLKDGVRLGGLGILIGLAGALGATRLLSSQLYGVRSTDPWTFLAVAFLLAAVAALAAYLPARRAARVDPITVLRQE